MESNKAYELYKQTKDEEYIKIISNNAHGIARKYINEGRKKGCVYFMDEEDIDYAINLGIAYALKTYDHSKSKFSTHLFRCVACKIVNLNKTLTTKNKKEKDIDILSANYEIQKKDGKSQEIIDLIACDKCLEEYNQETNYEIKDLINNLTDKNKKIAILLISGYSMTEISKVIGMSVSSVCYRIKNSLKKELIREEFLIV
mgnify:FL=1